MNNSLETDDMMDVTLRAGKRNLNFQAKNGRQGASVRTEKKIRPDGKLVSF